MEEPREGAAVPASQGAARRTASENECAGCRCSQEEGQGQEEVGMKFAETSTRLDHVVASTDVKLFRTPIAHERCRCCCTSSTGRRKCFRLPSRCWSISGPRGALRAGP